MSEMKTWLLNALRSFAVQHVLALLIASLLAASMGISFLSSATSNRIQFAMETGLLVNGPLVSNGGYDRPSIKEYDSTQRHSTNIG